MENRNGLAVNGCVTQATGRAEPQAAVAMWKKFRTGVASRSGADKGHDRKGLVQEMREHRVTPHFARKQSSIIETWSGCATSLPQLPE